MEEKISVRKIVLIISIIVIIACGVLFALKALNKKEKKEEVKPTPTPGEVATTGDFTVDIIKVVNNSTRENYLISPYNIEIALSMLREGADGNTKDEIDKVIGNRTIKDVSVTDTINVANGVFIKNEYKSNVKEDYITTMKNKFQSEILYDDFVKPDVINNWVNEKTNNMIPKLLDRIDESFMIGVASALAIDVKWESNFICENTTSEQFTNLDNTNKNVEMMHQTYKHDAKYIKTDDAEGVIIPYRQEKDSKVELEFVALLPNSSVYDYVNGLTNEKLKNIFNNTKDASDKYRIRLSLPRFTYSYSIDELDVPLKELGIKDAFNAQKANFKKMIDVDAYVGQAIHKTYIELNETGTKAAAVTFFGLDASAAREDDFEIVEVKFNKPFVYMIREKNSGEVLFFGSVYEPNEWKGSTCSKEQ